MTWGFRANYYQDILNYLIPSIRAMMPSKAKHLIRITPLIFYLVYKDLMKR